MSEFNFSDEMQKKLNNFNMKMLGLLPTLLVKPLALATDVFFRKDFGERYLTTSSVLVSGFLWVLATNFAYIYQGGASPFIELIFKLGLHRTAQWLYHHDYSNKVGWIVIFAHSFLAWRNLILTRVRAASGQVWYSVSRGSSIFGTENKIRDGIIAVVLVLVLGVFADSLGLLCFISFCVSHHLAAREQAFFYNQYLDAVDAKIQAEYLQRALDKGEPPGFTDGLYCPLSKDFKGEYRERVARVVAGGPFDAGVIDVKPEKPQARHQFATAQSSRPEPVTSTPAQQADLKSAFQDATGTAKETLSQILRSKRIIRFAVIGLVLLACVAVGVAVVRLIQSRSNQSSVAPVAVSQQTQPPAVTPATKPENPAVVENAKQEVLRLEERTKAEAALEIQKQKEKEKAAALEAQRRQEAERQAALEQQKHEENQRIFEQIKTTLAVETEQVSKFKAECQTRLDNNTNKIAGVARSARKNLNQFNDTARANFPKALQEQEDMLNHFQGLLPSLSADPQSDPRKFGDQMTNYIAAIEDTRQKFTTALNDLDTDISNAPKRIIIPFLNIKGN
jgi:hypothetical protein